MHSRTRPRSSTVTAIPGHLAARTSCPAEAPACIAPCPCAWIPSRRVTGFTTSSGSPRSPPERIAGALSPGYLKRETILEETLATHLITKFIDDIDGSEAEGTVRFAL